MKRTLPSGGNLSKLAGVAIFSKLDSNSRFWLIPLEESSRDLTTFITPGPHGTFRFNKVRFRTNSAQNTSNVEWPRGVIVQKN